MGFRVFLTVSTGFFAALASGAIAALPVETCNMTIENLGTTETPFYDIECVGSCDSGGCDDDSVVSDTQVLYICKCGNLETTAKCKAHFVYIPEPEGEQERYNINCYQGGCSNNCLEAELPVIGGTKVNACTCPDV